MSAEWPWSALDLDGQTDLRSVKRAYAKKLKTIDRNDADVFQSLRAALEEAKYLADVAPAPAPQKPSMRAAANGLDLVPGAVSYSFDFDDLPQTRGAQDERDTPQPEPHAVPDDTAATPQSAPQPAPPSPWSKQDQTPLTDAEKEAAFFDDLTATYASGVWKLGPLQEVLNRDIAMDRSVRDEAEYLLFQRLRDAVVEEERTISQGVAEAMEHHFGWASDGVQFNKKFGWHEGSELVAYDVARATKKDKTHTPQRNKKTPLHAKPARIFMCMLMYLGGVFVLYPDGLTAQTFFFAAFLSAIVFGIIWFSTLFVFHWGAALVRLTRRISTVDHGIIYVWQRLIGRYPWADKLRTALNLPGPLSTLLFSAAFVGTIIIMLLWGMSRA